MRKFTSPSAVTNNLSPKVAPIPELTAMIRESEAQLLDFCTRQHRAFQELDWLEAELVSSDEMAATCLFLGRVDWFGHKTQLVEIAAKLMADSNITFAELVSRIGFDCARFSNMLQRRIGHA